MAEASMRPVSSLPADAARNLVGVFTDIDDTITTDGRLPAAAYDALERLHDCRSGSRADHGTAGGLVRHGRALLAGERRCR